MPVTAISHMSPLHRRRVRPTHSGSAGRLRGRSASRRLGDLRRDELCLVARAARRFCFASPRRAISPYVGASEQEPAVGRFRSRDGHPGVTSW